MDEHLTIMYEKKQGVVVRLEFDFGIAAYATLLIKEVTAAPDFANDSVEFDVTPEVLRELANQFEQWADTLEGGSS